jgi:hypothetical protein
MADPVGDDLLRAVDTRDAERVSQILANKPRPNVDYNYRGYTPLDIAVDRGHLRIVVRLLNKGADKTIPFKNPAEWNGSKNAMEHSVEMVKMNPRNDQVIAIAFFLSDPGTPNYTKFEKQLADLAGHPSYRFTSEDTEMLSKDKLKIVEEREKAVVRKLNGKVMTELRAIPGGPDYELAKARFEGKKGGRHRSVRKHRRRARKTAKSRR